MSGTQTTSTTKGDAPARPEAVSLAARLWVVILAIEVAHQVVQATMALLDMSGPIAAARSQLEDAGADVPGDGLLRAAVVAATLIGALLSLVIVAVVAVMLRMYLRRSKSAGGARVALLVFGIFFAVRLAVPLGGGGGASDLHVAWFLADGALIIAVGVLAIVATILLFKKESADWARPDRARR